MLIFYFEDEIAMLLFEFEVFKYLTALIVNSNLHQLFNIKKLQLENYTIALGISCIAKQKIKMQMTNKFKIKLKDNHFDERVQ